MPSDPNPNLASSYGIGYKLLKQMGFSQGEGIGKSKGISIPIIHGELHPKQAGLGYFQSKTDPDLNMAKDKKEESKKKISREKNPSSVKIEKKRTEPLVDVLGNAHGNLVLNEMGVSIPFPFSSPKLMIEVEEKRLSLMKLEKEMILIQLPIYEALEQLTTSLSSSISIIKELISKLDITGKEKEDKIIVDFYPIISSELEVSLIENVKNFYNKIHAQNTTSSIYDDRVAGELRKAIKDSEIKACSILAATNSILIFYLLPVHKKGSLLDVKLFFPAIFTHQMLPLYLRVENSLSNIGAGPSISECIISGLLVPEIKNRLRSNTLGQYGSKYTFPSDLQSFPLEHEILWWLSVLPEDVCEQIVNSIILPYLKDLLEEVPLSDILSLISPWLPYSSGRSFVDCIFHRIFSSSSLIETVDNMNVSLEIIRCFDNIPSDIEIQLMNQLILFLSKKFIINPEEQELEVLELIISTSDIISLESLAKVLANGLFPLLCSYASAWMQSCTLIDLKNGLTDDMLQW